MDVVLDEISLAPCEEYSPGERIAALAATLKALDGVGFSRVLRSVSNAPDRDLAQGSGLRYWCFHRDTDQVAGRLIALRLGKQPFLDGVHGLFVQIEGRKAIEGRVGANSVVGLAYAALCDFPAVALLGPAVTSGQINVNFEILDESEVRQEERQALRLVRHEAVAEYRSLLEQWLMRGMQDGKSLLLHAPTRFSHLHFGPDVEKQIAALSGNEPAFAQLIRHLHALNLGAEKWQSGANYEPGAKISWSRESRETLRKYGDCRKFAMPKGFSAMVWDWHSKLTGGAELRLYFHPYIKDDRMVVLIGYFGRHLPTVKYS